MFIKIRKAHCNKSLNLLAWLERQYSVHTVSKANVVATIIATKKYHIQKIIQHIHSSFPSACIQYKLCPSYRPKGAEVTNP